MSGLSVRAVEAIPLPAVNGRIDHLAIDLHRGRLFVAALGSRTIEVLDLRSGRRLTRIPGWTEPQGVCFVPGTDRLFVTDGDGRCVALDGASLAPLRTATLAGDADNIRLDAQSGRVYVGFGEGGLAALDDRTGSLLAVLPLPSHPEAFQLSGRDGRVFVNLPREREVTVLDRSRGAVVARWHLPGAGPNYPMALDDAGHRLFVGSRDPGRLWVCDTRSGRVLQSLPLGGDADDLFFDPARARLYAFCGEGTLEIFASRGGRLATRLRVRTAPGARTGLCVPGENRLYVAAPRRGPQPAEILVFESPAH